MGVKARHVVANYLKIAGSEGTKAYERLTMGFSELNESFSPVVSSKRYIHQKAATSNITSYEWQSDFTADVIESEAAIKAIQKIAQEELVGEDCLFDYCIVDTEAAGTTDGTYQARERKVAIVVDELNDEDGELQFTGSFRGVTDWVKGEFNPTTKTFTEATATA